MVTEEVEYLSIHLTIIQNNTKMLFDLFTMLTFHLFHCVNICTHGAKTKVDKTADTLIQNKAAAPKRARITVFFITIYGGKKLLCL